MGNPLSAPTAAIELVEGPGVHIEGDAVSQLHRVAGLPGCVRAVGMPDLHPGPGIPIGMVAASVSRASAMKSPRATLKSPCSQFRRSSST